MKKIFLSALMALFVAIGASAEWTRPATVSKQNGVTVKIEDRRKNPEGTNRYGYLVISYSGDKNKSKVEIQVFGDGKLVDRRTVNIGKKTHLEVFDYGEPFGVVGYKPKIKEYTTSIQVTN